VRIRLSRRCRAKLDKHGLRLSQGLSKPARQPSISSRPLSVLIAWTRRLQCASVGVACVPPLGCTFPAPFDYGFCGHLCAPLIFQALASLHNVRATKNKHKRKMLAKDTPRVDARHDQGAVSPFILGQVKSDAVHQPKQRMQHSLLSFTQPPPLSSIHGRTKKHRPARDGCLAHCQCLDAANQLRAFG
jgi:hypothetical protein